MSSVWVCQRCERGEGCEVVKVYADRAGAYSWLERQAVKGQAGAEGSGSWATDLRWFTSVNRVDSWNIWEYEVTE